MNLFECLRRQRANVMAVAALWVVVLHSAIKLPLPFLNAIVSSGHQAVDLFVFLAGFGLAFALEKKPSCRVYWARRIKRLLPTYYASLILMVAVILIVGHHISLTQLCSRLLLTSVWLGPTSYWYVCGAMLYYLLAPAIWYALRYSRFPRIMLALLLAIFCLALPCATRGLGEIAIMRIPALVLGLMCGSEHFRDNSSRNNAVVLVVLLACCVCGGFLYMHHDALDRPLHFVSASQGYWLAFNLIAPLLSVVLAVCFELLERTPLRFLNHIFSHLGKYTFEIYMAQGILLNALGQFIDSRKIILATTLLVGYPFIRLLAWLGAQLLRLWTRLMRVCFPAEAD